MLRETSFFLFFFQKIILQKSLTSFKAEISLASCQHQPILPNLSFLSHSFLKTPPISKYLKEKMAFLKKEKNQSKQHEAYFLGLKRLPCLTLYTQTHV